MKDSAQPLLGVANLAVEYAIPGRAPLRAVDGISFELAEGECLALVGESGCGKTSVAKAILRLLPLAAGRVLFRPQGSSELVDWSAARGQALRRLRPQLQIVFQDPLASLNPRLEVGEAVAEVIRVHSKEGAHRTWQQAAELFEKVGLSPDLRQRFPHQLSGGQCQRVAIARALASRPRLLVCDEVVSALDVSIQAQVLNLLAELRASLGLSYLFISHDLAVVRQVSERVAVMQGGRIVEVGQTEALLSAPREEYTQRLLAAVPRLP